MEFDPLRRKAESEMQMGAGFPNAPASVLRMQNAALLRQEKSPALAGTRTSMASIGPAMTMRRSFRSCGGAGPQDILASGDAD